jgi:hypothetical protein
MEKSANPIHVSKIKVFGVHYDIAGYWVMVGGNKADMACLVEIVVVTDMVVAIMGEESWEVGKCE